MSTVVAIPLLFADGGDAEGQAIEAAQAGESAPAPTSTTGTESNSLLSSLNAGTLFSAGARDTVPTEETPAADDHSEAQAGAVTDGANNDAAVAGRRLATMAPKEGRARSALSLELTNEDSAEEPNTRDSSSPAAPDTTTATTAPPTSAAPTTAAPTTAAPTTAAPTTEAPTTTTPSTAPPTTAAPTTESAGRVPTAEEWAAVRECEAWGDYTVVSGNGLYYGGYQFGIPTWDSTAASAGRTDLIGVLPNAASPADQDAMALHLWTLRGPAPWPHCGKYLPPRP